jgi:hypothetical protein
MKWYIVYADEGPGGPCAQDCRTTSHWFDLYVLEGHYEDLRRQIEELKGNGRKNPRVVVFSDSAEEYEVSSYDLARHLIGADSRSAKEGTDGPL